MLICKLLDHKLQFRHMAVANANYICVAKKLCSHVQAGVSELINNDQIGIAD